MLGLDISDSITFDPAREAQYTSPLTCTAAYDPLVTMCARQLHRREARLATAWARTPDGKGWRFTLRDGREVQQRQPGHRGRRGVDASTASSTSRTSPRNIVANVDHVANVDDKTVDIVLKDQDEPMLTVLHRARISACWSARRWRRMAAPRRADAARADKATNWLNQHSAGAGAYTLVGWTRNAQIQLTRNPHYWRGMPAHFEHIVIRHMADSATQLLAIKRGDIDAAFNLIPEQMATLKGDQHVRVEGLTSLDFVYMALTRSPASTRRSR